MAVGVLMPQAGISVESCIITEWLKKPGDNIDVGDILFSYETDKASFECESTAAGTLLEIFFEDGDEVPVLINVCAVGNIGEDASALRPSGEAPAGGGEAAPAEAARSAAEDAPAPEVSPAPAAIAQINSGEMKISPRAKNLAASQSVDARLASPTGPYGRVIERDVRKLMEQGGASTSAAFGVVSAAAPGSFTGTGIGGKVSVNDLDAAYAAVPASAPDAPEYRDAAFTGIRRAISKSMTVSLSTIPQLTHTFSFDATEIMSFRTQLKEKGEGLGLPNITLNDMILYAVSRTLPKYPELNAHMLDGNNIRYFRDVHLGIAVDTERGLLVPVLKHANRKSLSQIAVESKALAKAAQGGSLPIDDMQGGTFTISNLGVFGVESFTPVINPPQTGILGVNAITSRPREINGEIKLYPAMGLSLTYDHRAIDGAPVSRFGKELCESLASFRLLLV